MSDDETTRKRFYAKVDRNGPVPPHCPELGPCHVWTGARQGRGYGRLRFHGKLHLANRVAFFLAHGRWPKACCLHRCDNPPCCNPAHLFDGTNEENTADRNAKRRQARGERNGQSKLSAHLVRFVRSVCNAGSVSRRALARKLGVSPSTINGIVSGATWVHLDASGADYASPDQYASSEQPKESDSLR